MHATAQVPVVVTGPQKNYNTVPNFKGCVAIGLGITQIITGAFVMIFEVVARSYQGFASVSLTGIWTGIFFIVNGVIGIRAGLTKNRNLVMAFMVLSIICALFGAGLVGYAITASFIQLIVGPSRRAEERAHRDNIIYGMTVAMVACGLLELIIAIISSAFCCAGICGQGTQPTQVMYVNQSYDSYPAAGAPGQQVSMYQQPGQPIAVATTEYDTKEGPPPY